MGGDATTINPKTETETGITRETEMRMRIRMTTSRTDMAGRRKERRDTWGDMIYAK